MKYSNSLRKIFKLIPMLATTTLFLISLQFKQIQEYIHIIISLTGTNFEGIPRFHRKYTDDFPVEHKKAINI